ncbi:MAG: septum formation initiator family protein [Nannocystaceae bacterium]
MNDPTQDPNHARTEAPSPRRRHRRQKVETRPHGWQRASDAPEPTTDAAPAGRRAAPAGTSLLLTLIVAVLTAIGIARVHATTRVLEQGAEITDLTAEQSRLLEERRRLAAERAYLRHPDHIAEVARNRLQMVPIAPDLVQPIRLLEETTP